MKLTYTSLSQKTANTWQKGTGKQKHPTFGQEKQIAENTEFHIYDKFDIISAPLYIINKFI